LPRQSLLHAPAQKISRIVVRRGSISNANHFPKWVKIQCNSTGVIDNLQDAAGNRLHDICRNR
jgi:hypothetical protein